MQSKLCFLQLFTVLSLLARLKMQLPLIWKEGGVWSTPVLTPVSRVRTNARGWAGLPEEPVLDLHTADLCTPLQCVARVTLEHRGVTSFPTVAAPAPILWDPRVIAGCCGGHWDKNIEEKVGLPCRQPDIEAPSVSPSLTSPRPSQSHCRDLCHLPTVSSTVATVPPSPS